MRIDVKVEAEKVLTIAEIGEGEVFESETKGMYFIKLRRPLHTPDGFKVNAIRLYDGAEVSFTDQRVIPRLDLALMKARG